MKKVILVVVLVFSAFGFDWNGKVNWAMNYESAKKLSQKTHKPIMVDFALSHCPPCKYLSTHIYTNDKVANFINRNFIPVLYIVDEQRVPTEIAQYFGGYTPTILIVKDGEEKYQFGFSREFISNPESFIRYLKRGLK